FMQLSGTSVAAPVVAGAVALMLEKNPGLTPPLVKAILQYTAQQVSGANILQQGAGLLNAEGATRLAGALRTDISDKIAQGQLNVGDSLLAANMPTQSSTIAGETFQWGGYIFGGAVHLLAGRPLITKYQAIYDPRLVWVGTAVTLGGSPISSTSLLSAGVVDA